MISPEQYIVRLSMRYGTLLQQYGGMIFSEEQFSSHKGYATGSTVEEED